MAQLPNLASSASSARAPWRGSRASNSGVAVQCWSASAASIGVVAGEMDAPLWRSSATSCTTRWAKRRLEPHQLGVTAAQAGGVDADDVLEAADGKVEALAGSGRQRHAVRRIGPVDEGEFLQGVQQPFNRGQGGAVDVPFQHRRRGAMSGVRVGAQVQRLQDLHFRPVQPLQRALHADAALARAASAGKSGTPGEMRSGRAENKSTQRVVAACLQFLAERANKRHQSNVTVARRLRPGGGPRRRRSRRNSISKKASGSPYKAAEVTHAGATAPSNAMAMTAPTATRERTAIDRRDYHRGAAGNAEGVIEVTLTAPGRTCLKAAK